MVPSHRVHVFTNAHVRPQADIGQPWLILTRAAPGSLRSKGSDQSEVEAIGVDGIQLPGVPQRPHDPNSRG